MEFLLILLAAILGFTIVIISVPPILRVAREKKLFDTVDERKTHTSDVPPLGGVAIFLGFLLSTIIATDGYSFDSLKYIIASIIIMFFIGLKDDLLDISARKKFIVQIFAVALLVTLGNVHLTHFHGILGADLVNPVIGTLLTLFVMLAIVNAYNLVDGIDGLAASLAMLAATAFGIWFYIAGHFQMAVMSFGLTGSLAGFFLYNVFGKKNKLFMGDTGSLVIGLVIATLAVKFNEMNAFSLSGFAFENAPAVSFAIVIVPLIDTLRVMTIRILNKKSPFAPDRNHIHHRLLELTPNHLAVTGIILAANVVLIAVTVLLGSLNLNVTLQFVFTFLLGILLSFVPSQLVRVKQKTLRARRKHSYAEN
jgi:UDP-N-acetylmuramyl pentapeptide phosphotransferase/UDP-N-acetylglucosamine-1-phosphate transferase